MVRYQITKDPYLTTSSPLRKRAPKTEFQVSGMAFKRAAYTMVFSDLDANNGIDENRCVPTFSGAKNLGYAFFFNSDKWFDAHPAETALQPVYAQDPQISRPEEARGHRRVYLVARHLTWTALLLSDLEVVLMHCPLLLWIETALAKKKAKRRKPIALLGIEPNSTLILTSLADCYTSPLLIVTGYLGTAKWFGICVHCHFSSLARQPTY